MGIRIEGLHLPTLIQSEVSSNLDVVATRAAEANVLATKATVDTTVNAFTGTTVPNAIADIGSAALQGIHDYNTNKTSAVTEYDDNAQAKINALNALSTTQLGQYNDNVTQKTTEFNTNAAAKYSAINDLHAAKTLAITGDYNVMLATMNNVATGIDNSLGQISQLQVAVNTISEYDQIKSAYQFDAAAGTSELTLDIPRGERGFMPIVEFELDPVTWELHSKIVDYMETGDYIEWSSIGTGQIQEYTNQVEW